MNSIPVSMRNSGRRTCHDCLHLSISWPTRPDQNATLGCSCFEFSLFGFAYNGFKSRKEMVPSKWISGLVTCSTRKLGRMSAKDESTKGRQSLSLPKLASPFRQQYILSSWNAKHRSLKCKPIPECNAVFQDKDNTKPKFLKYQNTSKMSTTD